ncbi:MAG: hypothetical protein AB8G17_01720 [Gammaproteobacteria bacterium]
MRRLYRFPVAGLITLMATSLHSIAASASILSINVDGVESYAARGDTSNTELIIDVGALLGLSGPITVTGLGWDVDLDAIDPSWLSDATAGLEGSDGTGYVDLRPGIDDTFAGTASYSSNGIIDLIALDLSFTLTDGLLHIEFFETFDDASGAVDAIWNGRLDIQAVPVPGAIWLFGCAIAALSFGARKRL